MEKKKEVPFEGQKKMYKNGDSDVFRKFNWLTWKNMTEGERAMWTEFSEVQRAPIPKETIEFEQKIEAANKPTVSEIDMVRAELKDRGIKFAYNSKLETLQKKLADADNPE